MTQRRLGSAPACFLLCLVFCLASYALKAAARVRCQVPRQLYSQFCGKCIYIGQQGLEQCEPQNCHSQAPNGFLCLTPEGKYTSSARFLAKQLMCFDWYRSEWERSSYVCPYMDFSPRDSCSGACLETVRTSVMCVHHIEQTIRRLAHLPNATLASPIFDFSRKNLLAYISYCAKNGYDVSSEVEIPCASGDPINSNVLGDFHVCRSSNNKPSSYNNSTPLSPFNEFPYPPLSTKCVLPYQLHARFCGRCIFKGSDGKLQAVPAQNFNDINNGSGYCCFDDRGTMECTKKNSANDLGSYDSDIIQSIASLFIRVSRFKPIVCPYLYSGPNRFSNPNISCSQICVDSLRSVVSGINAIMKQYSLSPGDGLLEFPATCLNDYVQFCAKSNIPVNLALSCDSNSPDTASCPSLLINSPQTLYSESHGQLNSSNSKISNSTNHESTKFPYYGKVILFTVMSLLLISILIVALVIYSRSKYRQAERIGPQVDDSDSEVLIL